jgi:hypothetical protein
MRLFRERLLAPLVERPAISEALVLELFAWRHPGFSARVGEAIPFELKKAIEDVACYLVRRAIVKCCGSATHDQAAFPFRSLPLISRS